MDKLFRSTGKKISLGLDIGTSTIKLIALRLNNENAELCGFKLEPATVELEQLITRILGSYEVKNINLSFSGPSTVIRYVNFLKMNIAEFKQALKFEAQKHIPFSLDEVNIDSLILKDDLPDNKMLVLLAAVKKDLVNQRLKLFENIGVKIRVMDMDSLALINAFVFNYSQGDDLKNKTVAILNVGASGSSLNILECGIPRLSRDIHIAGNSLTKRIQDVFGLDFKSAEEFKIRPDKERIDKLREVIKIGVTNLANEIRTSFDYFETQGASSVTKIFLSGGSSLSLDLKDALSNLLGIDVELWDPLARIIISEGIEPKEVRALAPQLGVAIGLALRR